MYEKSYGQHNDLLTVKEIQLIDVARMSSVDKHYVRVMAYCLASFKEMANSSTSGPFPRQSHWFRWFLEKFDLKKDDPFLVNLLQQFVTAADHLGRIAEYYQISPLELNLNHLINFHENQLDK